jgi:predicted enzyme related to lactoylglutathione lyase
MKEAAAAMTDPFHVLRRPLVRLAPDPAFAARLRDRVRHALTEGVPMTTQPQLATTEGDVAYLSLQLPDAARAREFYRAVLGWRFGAGEEPGHSAQVEGQSLPLGIWDGPPSPGIRTPGVLLVHRVADIVASTTTVRSLGGTAGPPHQEPYGVVADCLDDQGNGFSLLELPPDAARPPVNGALAGDVAYITISPGDDQRASQFYGMLFGWRSAPGNVPGGRQVDGPAPMIGLWGGTGRQAVTLMYLVDDITTAVARVRDAGGTATQPEPQPYGVTSQCTDNQEMTFTLGQL